MRCKTCDYRLWNLPSRLCPECGNPFAPSEFEFIPNTVQFLCPHCQQPYFGTTAKGHLDPPEFDCVNCGRHVHMDEMVLLPADHVREEQTAPEKCPWLDRTNLSFFRAWTKTIGMALTQPSRLIRTVPPESEQGPAWRFAILTVFVASIIGTLPTVLFQYGMLAVGPGGGGMPLSAMGIIFGFSLISPIIGTIATIVSWALITHGMLRITGGCRYTLGRTFLAMCYSCGTMAIAAIPFCGSYVAYVWWLVSAILMIRETQEVHGGRTALAVLTYPVLCLITCFGLMFYFFSLMNTVTTAVPATSFTASVSAPEVETIMTALTDFRDDHQRWPAHAVELLPEEYCEPEAFVTPTYSAEHTDLPFGNGTMPQYINADQTTQEEMVDRVIEGVPDNVVAHRMGDFVFTYHGVDPDDHDDLWLVILSPDPEYSMYSGLGMSPETFIFTVVGKADGSSESIGPESFANRMIQQNRLRLKYGLPPLPMPSNITNRRPWTSDKPVNITPSQRP